MGGGNESESSLVGSGQRDPFSSSTEFAPRSVLSQVDMQCGGSTTSSTSSTSISLHPRFRLRKRKFAPTNDSTHPISPGSLEETEASSSRDKKRRLNNFTKRSMSRCRNSCLTLNAFVKSTDREIHLGATSTKSSFALCVAPRRRRSLNCVSPTACSKNASSVHLPFLPSFNEEDKTIQESDFIDFISALPNFPQLPSAVSESSCSINTLNHAASLAALSRDTKKGTASADTSTHVLEERSYGWFIQVDTDDAPFKVSSHVTLEQGLAFLPSSPDSPTGVSDHQAQVEFALAADTVDDVLGDIF
eukprot:scaffold349146_cov63-Attheya_sp.AAC.1